MFAFKETTMANHFGFGFYTKFILSLYVKNFTSLGVSKNE